MLLQYAFEVHFLSLEVHFLVDRHALDSSPDHATPPHPLLPSTMNDRELGGQALSLYHSYIERGYPVALQLWSTQDGGRHCKLSCLPIQHLRPPTQLIKEHKPVNHKTRCRRRRDLKRIEQQRRAQGGGDEVHRAGD